MAQLQQAGGVAVVTALHSVWYFEPWESWMRRRCVMHCCQRYYVGCQLTMAGAADLRQAEPFATRSNAMVLRLCMSYTATKSTYSI